MRTHSPARPKGLPRPPRSRGCAPGGRTGRHRRTRGVGGPLTGGSGQSRGDAAQRTGPRALRGVGEEKGPGGGGARRPGQEVSRGPRGQGRRRPRWAASPPDRPTCRQRVLLLRCLRLSCHRDCRRRQPVHRTRQSCERAPRDFLRARPTRLFGAWPRHAHSAPRHARARPRHAHSAPRHAPATRLRGGQGCAPAALRAPQLPTGSPRAPVAPRLAPHPSSVVTHPLAHSHAHPIARFLATSSFVYPRARAPVPHSLAHSFTSSLVIISAFTHPHSFVCFPPARTPGSWLPPAGQAGPCWVLSVRRRAGTFPEMGDGRGTRAEEASWLFPNKAAGEHRR